MGFMRFMGFKVGFIGSGFGSRFSNLRARRPQPCTWNRTPEPLNQTLNPMNRHEPHEPERSEVPARSDVSLRPVFEPESWRSHAGAERPAGGGDRGGFRGGGAGPG